MTNELRLGNWINNYSVMMDERYKIVRPGEDPYKRITTQVQITVDILKDMQKFPQQYGPIKLTAEILVSCGFEKRLADENGQVWGILNFTLIYGRTDDRDFGWFLNGYHNDCHLKYLHQLQNLYYLVTGGTELTINLEKVKV